MTKEDYMKLSKERLAELLEERDKEQKESDALRKLIHTPLAPYQLPCYAPDGICTNPQKDCINCPKLFSGSCTWTTNTDINIKE